MCAKVVKIGFRVRVHVRVGVSCHSSVSATIGREAYSGRYADLIISYPLPVCLIMDN